MKFQNGTEIKVGDRCVGTDHFGGPCAGIVVKGVAAKGQPDFVFQNDAHGAVQPSLSLTRFLRMDEVSKAKDETAETSQPLTTA